MQSPAKSLKQTTNIELEEQDPRGPALFAAHLSGFWCLAGWRVPEVARHLDSRRLSGQRVPRPERRLDFKRLFGRRGLEAACYLDPRRLSGQRGLGTGRYLDFRRLSR